MIDFATVLDWIGFAALLFFGGLAGLLALFLIALPQLVTLMCLGALFSPRVYGDRVVYPSAARGVIFMGSWFAGWACLLLWLLSLDSPGIDIKASTYGLVAWIAHTIGAYVGMTKFEAPVITAQPETDSSPVATRASVAPLTIDHQPVPFRYASWNDEE
jgi:hypothetical protein